MGPCRAADSASARDNHMMLERKTVSIPRACELVGVSRRTIYNWIAERQGPVRPDRRRSVRIFADTLWREPDGPADERGPGASGFSRGA